MLVDELTINSVDLVPVYGPWFSHRSYHIRMLTVKVKTNPYSQLSAFIPLLFFYSLLDFLYSYLFFTLQLTPVCPLVWFLCLLSPISSFYTLLFKSLGFFCWRLSSLKASPASPSLPLSPVLSHSPPILSLRLSLPPHPGSQLLPKLICWRNV